MDPAPDDGVAELLEILRRAEENDGKRGDAGNRIQSLPRTSSDFESSRLRSILHGRLEVELGAMVNAVLCSDDLKLNATDGAEPNAVDQAVAGLTGSPSFVGVVDKARAAIARAAPAPAADLNGVAPGTAGGSFFRRNLDALSSSDTEREDMHVKKKAARRNDWVDIFDRSGGLGGGMGFSPRVDVEAAMAQLEAGLASPGGSPASAVEALGSLAEVGDHNLFLQQSVILFSSHLPTCDTLLTISVHVCVCGKAGLDCSALLLLQEGRVTFPVQRGREATLTWPLIRAPRLYFHRTLVDRPTRNSSSSATTGSLS